MHGIFDIQPIFYWHIEPQYTDVYIYNLFMILTALCNI